MSSNDINFSNGGPDQLSEKDGTFSTSEECSTSDVESSTSEECSTSDVESSTSEECSTSDVESSTSEECSSSDVESSTSEECSTSDVESSTKSSVGNVCMEEDIETDEEQERVELFHSTSGLDLQGPYMIHTTTFEEVQAYLDQCLQIGCWNVKVPFRVIYGPAHIISNEECSNVGLKIQGRCIFFHEKFTNSGAAIEKASFYFSNWHIFQQTRDSFPFKSSSGVLYHANNGLPALQSNKNYMTVMFLKEKSDNAWHEVVHGDCIIFPTDCLQQLQPVFSYMTCQPLMNVRSFFSSPRVQKKTVAETECSNKTKGNREHPIRRSRSVSDNLEYDVESTSATYTMKIIMRCFACLIMYLLWAH